MTMPRMRTAEKVLAEIREADPETEVTLMISFTALISFL